MDKLKEFVEVFWQSESDRPMRILPFLFTEDWDAFLF